MTNKDFIYFHSAITKDHSRVDPCFMTGKGCVYTHVIGKTIEERVENNSSQGFMIMPFRPNLDVFFHNTLHPFFIGNYQGTHPNNGKLIKIDKLRLVRADEVKRPGIIICEGICKRIQESNFVVVDLSLPNDNVFYELGLAYGIGHKIIAIYYKESEFGKEWAEKFELAGLKAYAYNELNPIKVDQFEVSNYIWKQNLVESTYRGSDTELLFYENYLPEPNGNIQLDNNEVNFKKGKEFKHRFDDIDLSFRTHVLSNIGLATNKIIDEIRSEDETREVIKSYIETIEKLKIPKPIKVDAPFQEIKNQVDKCYCLVVRTGKDCHPMSYFWLGYGHAQGKNVIPITVLKESGKGDNAKENIDDLAFDIRAQRHMIFLAQQPLNLQRQLETTLREMIENDFLEWSRTHFWNKMLGRRGEVHIFTGALHNEEFNREMIGDWDLRAASELTSYFSRHQYRAKIETPIYSPEYALYLLNQSPNLSHEEYIEQLKDMMKDKNCILIASPDVNPLTEIVLGEIYKVPSTSLFKTTTDTSVYTDAIIVIKENPKKKKTPLKTGELESHKEKDRKSARRAFYKEINNDDTIINASRGFQSNQLPHGKITTKFVSQQSNVPESFDVYAHLVVARNPFNTKNEEKYIIILNGVSGPATFALTHVLTGGVNEEFVSYESGFNQHAVSEKILNLLLDKMPTPNRSFKAMECIIKVTVGPAYNHPKPEVGSTFDWRRILKWEIDDVFKIRIL